MTVTNENFWIVAGTVSSDGTISGTAVEVHLTEGSRVEHTINKMVKAISRPQVPKKQERSTGTQTTPEVNGIDLNRISEKITVTNAYLVDEASNSALNKKTTLLGFVTMGGPVWVAWGSLSSGSGVQINGYNDAAEGRKRKCLIENFTFREDFGTRLAAENFSSGESDAPLKTFFFSASFIPITKEKGTKNG